MNKTLHNFCVAGTHSGTGKTTVTLGLLTALKRRGLRVQPFKCGPDYIDPEHHYQACGEVSRNLDAWMMGEDAVRESYRRGLQNADVALTEGVMGLYDGASATDITGSSAHICSLLNVPVVLVVDAGSMARSIAAVVKGFDEFEEGVNIVGVIANRVGSENHARILTEALESEGLPPLIGAIPKDESLYTPERHLGLVAEAENKRSATWYEDLAEVMESYIDIDNLLELTVADSKIFDNAFAEECKFNNASGCEVKVKIGVARDKAFHFYYEDNLDIMRDSGADLVFFSPLQDTSLPENLDGLYIGGGFPESFAAELSANEDIRQAISNFAESGGYIYAECGGFMYLGQGLTDKDGDYFEMCGVLPAQTQMEERLHRLGYIEAFTLDDGLFGRPGTKLRGHEFHWSSSKGTDSDIEPAFKVKFLRSGSTEALGMHRLNVWASYAHIHFASNPEACRQWLASMSKSG